MSERPDVGHVYIPGDDSKSVIEVYFDNADDAFRALSAAEALGFGWMMLRYQCPTGDENTTVPEYRLTVYRDLMSETLPMLPERADQ